MSSGGVWFPIVHARRVESDIPLAPIAARVSQLTSPGVTVLRSCG
nr:MAG TPA: hypothetical protein [Caudoviricetes sp.]